MSSEPAAPSPSSVSSPPRRWRWLAWVAFAVVLAVLWQGYTQPGLLMNLVLRFCG